MSADMEQRFTFDQYYFTEQYLALPEEAFAPWAAAQEGATTVEQTFTFKLQFISSEGDSGALYCKTTVDLDFGALGEGRVSIVLRYKSADPNEPAPGALQQFMASHVHPQTMAYLREAVASLTYRLFRQPFFLDPNQDFLSPEAFRVHPLGDKGE